MGEDKVLSGPSAEDFPADDLFSKQRTFLLKTAKNSHSNASEEFCEKNQLVSTVLRRVLGCLKRWFLQGWVFVLHPDWPAARNYARSAFVQDWDKGQGIVWYALCHLAGVLCYFSLPAEPWGL